MNLLRRSMQPVISSSRLWTTPSLVLSSMSIHRFLSPNLTLVSPVSTYLRTKTPSKRLDKPYKLKNHRGASSRWLVVGYGQFLRKQAATGHFNRKMRAWKRESKKKMVLANVQQRGLLRRLVPYHKKKYMKRIGGSVDPAFIDWKY